MEPSLASGTRDAAERPYACWCLWHGPRQLVYVYGHTLHCREILHRVHPSRCVAKGFYRTLESAMSGAEAAAAAWRAFAPAYAGTRAMSMVAYLAEFPDPGLLCDPIEPPAAPIPPD